jgi:hypothetical protein
MRSLTYVQPGQTLACIGCHEQRDTAPKPTSVPLAMLREPSKLTPGPTGSWPLRYDQLVQPVLDKHCVSCHRPGAEKAEAAALDLTAAAAYQKLLDCYGGDLQKLVFERDRSIVGGMPAQNSKLYKLLTGEPRHYDVKLSDDDRQRLVTWMDTYGQQAGSFSEQQERELLELREKFAALLSP